MDHDNLTPEQQAREQIDKQLIQAGWVIQDKKRLNLYESVGIAVREMDTDTGPADYMLFIDGKACGIIEAKKEGTNLGQVAEQSGRYATSQTKNIRRWVGDEEPLPFLYEATNVEIYFRDERDPKPRSRSVFHFHQPETCYKWLQQADTFRSRLQQIPALNTDGLRDCQIEAITGTEDSLKQAKSRALLQMATGAGKTYTAVTQIYRLAKFSKVKRVLFLVDRGNLGRQALKEFQQYTLPEDGRKFTELYNVSILGTAGIADETKVTISTIQRLYSQLTGKELDEEADEHSGYEIDNNTFNKQPKQVSYNPAIPIEAFDLIIIDECHRSIYNLWRQVLEYFDAFLVGLTATPTKKTIGFFNQNMVSEYTQEDAVIGKVNVGYDIYSIRTKKTEEGDKIEAGTTVQIHDKLTRKKRLEILDQDEEYTGKQIDRSIIAPNQIITIIQTLKDRVFTDIFPDRSGEWLPKTLIFAKDDDHAERIVNTVREVFGEGNNFCKKITYKVGKKTAEETITEFRTSPQLRAGVTVDMIATGTDIRPLEIVMFMRDVKSPAYYEQMKGRGTRIISQDEFRKVTPDAKGKARFVLIDCVGVTETDKTELKSLETKPSVSTAKLMEQIARGDRHSDSLRSLGNRLIRLDIKLDAQQRKQIAQLAGKPLALIAGEFIHGTNEDTLVEQTQTQFNTENPTEQQIQQAFETQADELVKPFHNPDLRELIEALRRDSEQIIDESADELLNDKLGYSQEKAESCIKSWEQFIKDHQDELDAIQLIYNQPYQQRHLSYEQIEKLAEEIEQPPYNLAPIAVWKAYEQLEKAKVKGAPPEKLLTNIISLIRYSTGLSDVLEPFNELVNNRFENWMKQQNQIKPPHHQRENARKLPLPQGEGWGEGEKSPLPLGEDLGEGRFSQEQLQWLNKIKDQIAQNAEMTVEDFEYTPFNQDGGLLKAKELFGNDLDGIIQELNGYLIA